MSKANDRVKLVRNGFVISVLPENIEKMEAKGFKRPSPGRGRPKKA